MKTFHDNKKKGKGIYDSKPALQKTLEGILQSKEKNKSLRPRGRKDDARIIVKQEGTREEKRCRVNKMTANNRRISRISES